ncbi:MAG: hypothetical protein JNK72_21505 [Myxococcales bacterium]|nr:hypothetical protein [Myxococcales bacterium]
MKRRAMALLGVILGCADLPALATNGEIRSGTGGSCPEGFVARLGRCCPEGSSDVVCPNGPGLFGGACASNDQCTSDAASRACLNGAMMGNEMLPAYPAGYCTERCSTGQGMGCANGTGLCLGNPFLPSQGLCLRKCQLPAGRSVGPCSYRPNETASYRCVNINPDDRTQSVCVANCVGVTSANHGCPTGRACVTLVDDPSFGSCSSVCLTDRQCPTGWTCTPSLSAGARACRPPL